MKKYFIKQTGEVLEYGDVISIAFEKKDETSYTRCEKEVEFTKGMEDILEELGIIEGKEEEDSLIDFDSPCKSLQELLEDFEELEERVDKLESLVEEHFTKVKANPKKK